MEIIICDSDNVNAGKIKDICFQYSFQWEEESEIKIINAREEMYSYMKASNLTSLIIAETAIVKGEMISEKLKEQFVLVMGHTPEELLNLVSPSFRPAGLLVKPVKKEKLEHLLSEVWKEYKKAQTRENMFSLKIRSQEYVLPQSKILFFESRNKKIVLRTSTQEIEFYDTLEHLQSVLNKDFIRIHKSFLVNISLVTMVHFSNMMVHFNGGVFVPVSRTYKAVLSEKWKQRKEKLGDRIFIYKRGTRTSSKTFSGEKGKNWSEKEILSANSLEKKKLISGWQGSISVEPFLAAFVKVMNEPEKKADFEEGILYVKKGLVLWKYADCHTLNGIVLKPYPTMESWFLEEKENLKESMEYYDQALQKKSETL